MILLALELIAALQMGDASIAGAVTSLSERMFLWCRATKTRQTLFFAGFSGIAPLGISATFEAFCTKDTSDNNGDLTKQA